MAGCGLPRTNPRAPSFSLCCSPTVRRLLVLHEESNPTTSSLVRASDADEIIDDRIDILRLDRCFVVRARVCQVPTHASVAEKSTRDTPSSPPNAMPRPECRSAGLKSMKQSSCAAFGLAVRLPAESATAESGPCYAKAQTSPRDRERRGAFPVVRSAPVKVFGCRPHDGGAAHAGGRRPQTSKGGNRGMSGEVPRQTLWGFDGCRAGV